MDSQRKLMDSFLLNTTDENLDDAMLIDNDEEILMADDEANEQVARDTGGSSGSIYIETDPKGALHSQDSHTSVGALDSEEAFGNVSEIGDEMSLTCRFACLRTGGLAATDQLWLACSHADRRREQHPDKEMLILVRERMTCNMIKEIGLTFCSEDQ